MSSFYDISLFGDSDLTKDLISKINIKNFKNYADKDISIQIKAVSSLDTLISLDDWITQVSGVYDIPSIVIYGSSSIAHTSPWLHPNAILLTKNLYCSPCQKTKCPLKSQDCMQQIKAKDVYNAYTKLKTNYEITIQKV